MERTLKPRVPLFLAKLMTVPVMLYCVFFSIRLGGYQPEAEAELGEFLTALFFIAGAGVCYFAFAAQTLHVAAEKSSALWWWLSAAFLLLLAFDEIYMIHENVSRVLEFREQYVFLIYLAMLATLLLINRARVLRRAPFFFFFMFGILSGISVVADTLCHEGVIHAFGHEIDYEQLAESTSAIFISCGFAAIAMAELLVGNEANRAQ